ncbi:MAG TPA: Asp-tRNA(Asn)/Glu-tRNA(Gln) amidotransferase subunit GatC [Polyangia bacterium]|jgi:aspartyl-tRNA(Asn)/glutamyl-tRNA(Gln) amidotransferase subunit C
MPQSRISADEVKKTALLARLELSEAEVAQLCGELDAILGYVQALSTLDVDGIEPTTHAVPLDCPLREDRLGPQLDVEAALADAPRRQGELFEVPKIIEVGE